MLLAQNLTKNYDKLPVLRGVSLAIGQGQVVGITGPSGAGKTTLLQILGTLDTPDQGTLTLEGQSLLGLSAGALARLRNRRLGFVFQFHNLLQEFSAVENVLMPALLGGAKAAQAQPRAMDLLSLLGLADRASHRPAELSGGEQQRVAVARALINQPALVLADEPSGNLDTDNAQALHDLFFDLRDQLGQTFIIVTHNTSLAARCDMQLHMRDGLIDAAPAN